MNDDVTFIQSNDDATYENTAEELQTILSLRHSATSERCESSGLFRPRRILHFLRSSRPRYIDESSRAKTKMKKSTATAVKESQTVNANGVKAKDSDAAQDEKRKSQDRLLLRRRITSGTSCVWETNRRCNEDS